MDVLAVITVFLVVIYAGGAVYCYGRQRRSTHGRILTIFTVAGGLLGLGYALWLASMPDIRREMPLVALLIAVPLQTICGAAALGIPGVIAAVVFGERARYAASEEAEVDRVMELIEENKHREQ